MTSPQRTGCSKAVEGPCQWGDICWVGGLGAGGTASAWPRVWAVASALAPCRALEGPGPRDVLQQCSSLHTVVESTVGVQSGPGCGASPPLSGCKDEVLFSNKSFFVCLFCF